MVRFGTTLAFAKAENIVTSGDIRISVISNKIVRVEKKVGKCFIDNKTQTVMCRNYSTGSFNISKDMDKVIIQTNYAKFIISIPSLKYKVFIKNEEVFVDHKRNLKGTIRTLDGNSGFVRFPDGLLSRSGLTILDDSKSAIIETDGSIKPREKGYIDFYILAFGTDYLDGLKEIYSLTGSTPIIPKYALGNWWSRYHAYSDHEYIELMDKFRDKNIPITVATVDMDWHIVKNVPKNVHSFGQIQGPGWTGYTFEKALFPDYKKFFNDLKARGLHITLNLHPRDGVRYYESQYEDMAKANGIDPKTHKPVKFDLTNAKFRDSYFDILHHPYEKDGVDFWWIDWQQGKRSKLKGVDPLWLLNHYHFLDINREKQGIILSRFSGIGSHRYPLGFSGDTIVTWKSLKLQPYFTITADNVGYSWWSHDIGGHMYSRGEEELYLRWLQFGVFSPINRLHSTCHGISKEPWLYPGVEEIAKKFMQIRHRLIPFIYSASIINHNEGIPVCSPLYYFFEDENAYKKEFRNEYMFGEQMLVCPVTDKGDGKSTKLEVWFPEGEWINIFNGKTYEGSIVKNIECEIDEYPVYVRPGTFIPELNVEYNELSYRKLDIITFLGNGSYRMYDENGYIDFKIESSKNGYVISMNTEGNLETKEITFKIQNIESAVYLVDGIFKGCGKDITVDINACQIIIKNIIQK